MDKLSQFTADECLEIRVALENRAEMISDMLRIAENWELRAHLRLVSQMIEDLRFTPSP
jgi:hypothetical protein